MKSEITKKAKTLKIIFLILHILCLVGPFLFFVPFGFASGVIVSKIALGLSVVIALILAMISFLVDTKHRAGLHRSIMWILIGGVLFCLESIKPFIWIMTGVSLCDELIFTKCHDHYKRKYLTNKEIDKRF